MATELVTGFSGHPHITAEQAAAMNSGIFGKDTYILQTANMCACKVSGSRATVNTGDIMAQGRHIQISSTETFTIQTSSQNMRRHDFIGVQYKKDTSGTETATLELLKGTPQDVAQDPTYSKVSILDGAQTVFIPIWRIVVDGTRILEPQLLVPVAPAIGATGDIIEKKAKELTDNVTKQVQPLLDRAVSIADDAKDKYTKCYITKDGRDRLTLMYIENGVKKGVIVRDNGLMLYDFTRDKIIWTK